MSVMFSKLCDRWKGSTKIYTTSVSIENPLQSDIKRQPEVDVGRRFRSLRRLIHRYTKEEEILLLEKKFLKKYLQYYKCYSSGMTLGEMRFAKRFLDVSVTPNQWLEEEPPDSSCVGCHCFCYKRNSKASPKRGKRVTFKQHLVQLRQISVSSESSDEEDNANKAREAREDPNIQTLPIVTAVDTNPSSIVHSDSEFHDVPLGKTGCDTLNKLGCGSFRCTSDDCQTCTYIDSKP